MEAPTNLASLTNPFLAIRRRTGLSQVNFAHALGIGPATVQQAEAGISAHPRTIILALARLGYDPQELQEQYSAWRAARLAHLRQYSGGPAPCILRRCVPAVREDE